MKTDLQTSVFYACMHSRWEGGGVGGWGWGGEVSMTACRVWWDDRADGVTHGSKLENIVFKRCQI